MEIKSVFQSTAGARRSSCHSSVLPHGHGPQQRPQNDHEPESQLPAPHQEDQVRAGHDPRGVQLHPIGSSYYVAARGLQR